MTSTFSVPYQTLGKSTAFRDKLNKHASAIRADDFTQTLLFSVANPSVFKYITELQYVTVTD